MSLLNAIFRTDKFKDINRSGLKAAGLINSFPEKHGIIILFD